MTFKKDPEYTRINQDLIKYERPIYDIVEEFQNLPQKVWGNLSVIDDPDYYTVDDFVRVFERCHSGEVSVDELNVWASRFADDGTLKPVPEYKKLLYSIVFAFEDLDRVDEPITPEFVELCLEKLRNAQPETHA